MKKTILVAVDFSKISEKAIEQAAGILKTTKGDLLLFHVVKNSKELFAAQKKIKPYRVKVQEKYPDITVKALLRIGDFLESIGYAALENRAELIVMGTHGMKGLQFITGSRALKIVSNSEVPIIIVQEDTEVTEGFKNMLLPMTYDKDSKQKLAFAKHLALYFSSKIFLLAPDEKDEFLQNQIERDINFSKQYFKDANLEYQVEHKPGVRSLEDYLEYSEEQEVDLIVFMNQPESAYIFFDDRVQKVITNKSRIPVLLINPKTTSIANIFGNYSGQG